jgi:hypothetical protein
MDAERGRLRHQQYVIGVSNGFHSRARGPGRRVDYHDAGFGCFLGPPDQRRRLHLADIQSTLDHAQLPAPTSADSADRSGGLRNRLLRANHDATAAAPTKFREMQHPMRRHHQRLEPADLRALPAKRAPRLIDLGYWHTDLHFGVDVRGQKQPTVRLLDITVDEYHRLPALGQHRRQIGGDSGLAGAAFAACDCYLHDPLTQPTRLFLKFLDTPLQALEGLLQVLALALQVIELGTRIPKARGWIGGLPTRRVAEIPLVPAGTGIPIGAIPETASPSATTAATETSRTTHRREIHIGETRPVKPGTVPGATTGHRPGAHRPCLISSWHVTLSF